MHKICIRLSQTAEVKDSNEVPTIVDKLLVTDGTTRGKSVFFRKVVLGGYLDSLSGLTEF